MKPGFWKGKKVFITGHTGFKGSWLVLLLEKLGAEVSGFSVDIPTKPSLFDLCGLKSSEKVKTTWGDVRDPATLLSAVKAARPEVVVHMAAQPLVRKSYADPLGTFAVNVLGTANLLEAVRQAGGVRAAVMVTSDKCYANREWEWGYRENEPLGGHDPYSASKACAEIVAHSMANSFFGGGASGPGAAVATVRAGNVIGGGDWAQDRLIPDIMNALKEKRPVVIRHPGASRPWQHVLDPLNGYLTVAERLWEEGPGKPEAWNFGPSENDVRPVSWIVDKLIKEWGAGEWRKDAGVHPHEAFHLKLDCAKARARLGWRPRWSLATTLASIADWHRALESGKDMKGVSLGQVEKYLSESGASDEPN